MLRTEPAIIRPHLNPLDMEREAIGQAFQASHRDRIAIGQAMWQLWLRWKLAHPQASRRQYLDWLNLGLYSGNLYAYLDAGAAAVRGWQLPTLGSMTEVGKAVQAGMTREEIEAHLGNGTLGEAVRKRPLSDPDPALVARDRARAAVREVSETDNLTNEEADTRGAEMLAALPRTIREAAARAVDTGQAIPDAVADVVRETFSRVTYYDYVHTLPCQIPGCGVTGNIEAHHLLTPSYPGREAGRRSHDALVPLCTHHHQHARDAAHAGGQAAWSAHHWGTADAVFAVALDTYTDFVLSIGALRREV